MTILWLDFETRSRVDLTVAGAYNYAQDMSTEVLCMSYAFDDDEVVTWRPGETFPEAVRQHKGQIRAHNAAFERLIFWYVLQINFDLEQFYCTAAQARANCAPGSLEDVGRFAGAGMRKDHRGAQLIRLLSIPQADGTFREDAALMAEMVAYCEQDVRAMRAFSQAMRDLSADELADYHANERVNDRGVLVDVALCKAAQQYAVQELDAIQAEVREITEGVITSVRSPRMREWVWERVGPEARRLMTVHKDGEEKQSIDKSVRAALLILAEENPDEVPAHVADVIQCADDLWASSVAKFKRLEELADVEDHRVRGAFVFAGGAATGRASSYGAQVHNFTRKTAKDPQAVRHAMVRGHQIVPQFGKRVTDVLRGMLRPSLIPAPGHSFVVADWSAIEGRVNPWLAKSPAGEAKLDAFRQRLDAYIVNAAATFGRPYADILAGYEAEEPEATAQRQLGKVQELACGFAGSVGAFNAMGRAYGVVLPEVESRRMVNAWRRANPWAPAFWSDLERAYSAAMRRRGQEFSAGRIAYLFDGAHLWYALPSGRILCYPYARLDKDGISYAKAAWKPAADAKEWPRARLWPGLACIAKGTPVLTQRGWVPIERIRGSDPVWDGVEWVSHDGLAHQGLGRVNYAFGVAMTADHLVLTEAGWKRADQIQGHRRAACRIPDSEVPNWHRWAARCVAHIVRVRANAGHETSGLHEVGQHGKTCVVRVQEKRVAVGSAQEARYEPASGVCGMAVYARPLPVAVASSVEKLWRAGHYGLRQLAGVVREFLGRYGANVSAWAVFGSDRQRRAIFAGQLPVGDLPRTSPKHSRGAHGGQSARPNAGVRTVRTNGDRADDTAVPAVEGRDWGRSDCGPGHYAEVFDIVNCGPRRRFVVKGVDGQPLIVHNCENVTQATAHDLLRGALRGLERIKLEVILTVHDEIVLECATETAEAARLDLLRVMCSPPSWAQGLPLDAGSKIMERYGK